MVLTLLKLYKKNAMSILRHKAEKLIITVIVTEIAIASSEPIIFLARRKSLIEFGNKIRFTLCIASE